MVNGQLMYLRPGNLFKDFIIEHSKSDLKSGRPSVSYEGDGTDFLRGCLASAFTFLVYCHIRSKSIKLIHKNND